MFFGLGRWLEIVGGEIFPDEGIDGIGGTGLGDGGFFNGCECPVLLVFGSLGYPAGDELLLLFRKGFVEIRWWHDVVLIRRVDALPGDAFLRVAGDDCVFSGIAFEGGEGSFLRV